MSITLIEEGNACRLIFSGRITQECWCELEGKIIDAMRRFSHFRVDLSGVQEIDLCGIHLLGMLNNLGGENVKIVATSEVVDQASRHLLASQRLASLGRASRVQSVGNRTNFSMP